MTHTGPLVVCHQPLLPDHTTSRLAGAVPVAEGRVSGEVASLAAEVTPYGPLGWLNACPGHQAARPRDATAARSSPAAHRSPSRRPGVVAAARPGVRAGRVRQDDPARAVAGVG